MSARPVIIVLSALIALLCAAGWIAYRQFSHLSILRQEKPASDFFGGTDWVTWVDTDTGVTAVRLHPLLQANPLLREAYIRPGDVLRSIDYTDVHSADMVRTLTARAAPGTVFIYILERPSEQNFAPENISLFVENSFEPVLAFSEKSWMWSLQPWWSAPGIFFSLITLLILFPILRREFREHRSDFLILILALFIFVAIFSRYLLLQVSPSYTNASGEAWFVWVLTLLICSYGWFFLRGITPQFLKWLALLPGIAVAAVAFAAWQAVFSREFWLYRDWLLHIVFLCWTALLFAALLISIFQRWSARSSIDKWFHLLSAPYTGALCVYWSIALFSGTARGEQAAMLLSLGALFIPLVSATASQLKFGKVSVVLNQSLEYLLFGLSTLALYFIVHFTMDALGVKLRYQNVLEMSAVIVGVVLLWAVFRQYESRLSRYFISSQRKQRDAVREFILRIPGYTSTGELIAAVQQESRSYFHTRQAWFWEEGISTAQDFPLKDEELLKKLFGVLQATGTFWSQNKQLSAVALDDVLEQELKNENIQLVFPAAIRRETGGLMLLGVKGRGVYNLDDVDLIQSIIQPTRLTLGVLYLVEREKLLMQKNYEANLTALRSQINPHFLFNTLNTISSLIHDSPNDAEAATEKLAYIFRYTLKHSSQALVKLGDELTLVRTYLEIEQLRFGARLQPEFRIEKAAEDVEMPAFALQTIIENCIKHGIAKIIGKGVVTIDATRLEDQSVKVVVYDNGPGINLSRINSSTGLNNIITRFEQIYSSKNLLTFENTGNGTRVTLHIPAAPHGNI